MMRIDVRDQNAVEIALVRLLAGVSEQPAGVDLFDRDAAAAIGKKVHGVAPDEIRHTENKAPRRR
jgi:hypothetical protein